MARHWIDETGDVWTRAIDDDWPGAKEVIPVVVGSREWAVVMVLRGERVWNDGMGKPNEGHRSGETAASMYCLTHDSVASQLDSGWYVVPPSPPPLKRGDRVRGVGMTGAEWIGPYWGPDHDRPGSHYMGAAGESVWVKSVERIEP